MTPRTKSDKRPAAPLGSTKRGRNTAFPIRLSGKEEAEGKVKESEVATRVAKRCLGDERELLSRARGRYFSVERFRSEC